MILGGRLSHTVGAGVYVLDIDKYLQVRNMVETADADAKTDADTVVTVSVSMRRSEKERLASMARSRGMSLSALLRLAANEYVRNNEE